MTLCCILGGLLSYAVEGAHKGLVFGNGADGKHYGYNRYHRHQRCKAECEDAMAPTTQLNAWLRFYLKYNYNIETVAVEYSDISPYFMDDEIEKYTKLAGLSVPVKLELAAMARSNPQKSMGMDFLERQLLKLGTERWNNPLVSSNTQSTVDGENGAPTKEDGDLTDEGEASRDKDTNQK